MKGTGTINIISKRNRLKESGRLHNDTKGGQKTFRFACSVPKEFCWGKHHAGIGCIVHGSPEDAQRCINSYAEKRKQVINLLSR